MAIIFWSSSIFYTIFWFCFHLITHRTANSLVKLSHVTSETLYQKCGIHLFEAVLEYILTCALVCMSSFIDISKLVFYKLNFTPRLSNLLKAKGNKNTYCLWFVALTYRLRDSKAILVHQLSKKFTQRHPFKLHGLPVSAVFHPTRSIFFVSTKKNVRVYDLLKQKLIKKLETGLREVSSISVHPAGLLPILVGRFYK